MKPDLPRNLRDEAIAYHAAAPRLGWWTVPVAGMYTLLVFLILPFSEVFSTSKARALKVIPVDTAARQSRPAERRVTPPRPDTARPIRPPTRQDPAKAPSATPAPVVSPAPARRLSDEVRDQRLRLPVSMDFGLPGQYGDYTLDFAVGPGPTAGGGEALGPAAPAVAAPEPVPQPEILDESVLDTPPRPISQPEPVYPYRARARNLEGYAEVVLVVSPAGLVTEAHVTDAVPAGFFEEAARQAVMRWRFEPGVKTGQKVNARMRVRLRFALH